MSQYKALIEKFGGRRPVINIILDGYGLGKEDHTDAIFQASTPFMDKLRANYANTELATHGFHVGLPGETDLGGSEVGHLTIGAGTIIPQGPTMITNAIQDGSFFKQPVLQAAIEEGKKGALHLIGLLSDGNVHSHISHFIAVIEEAARQGVEKCYVHALLDGRDVGIQTADEYVEQVEEAFQKVKAAHPDWDYAFASAGGREVITMDRDKNWAKMELGWKTHVEGKSGEVFDSMKEAIDHFRAEISGLVDQDCTPFNIKNDKGEIPVIKDGDSVISMNFRADRASQFAQMMTDDNFDGFPIENKPKIYFAGMMIYDEDSNLPENKIMGSPVVELPFGKRMNNLGLNQFRLAETQKYAHVTFFFNGGYRNPLLPEKEEYFLIDSDKIPSFADAPNMKAPEIAEKAEELILSKKYDYGLINIANADMVGHTGDFKAAVQAVETTDKALQRICEAVEAVNGIALITADHGNADTMIVTNKKTQKEEVSTKHTINLVPCVLFDPEYKEGDYQLKECKEGEELNLAMIAATNHILLGLEVPEDLNPPLFEEQ